MVATRTIRCPRCKEKTQYSAENAFRPFCSKRCQTIDIAGWASEEFFIANEKTSTGDELNSDSQD